VNLLLDTHALIWFLLGKKQLSPAARRAIESSKNCVLISAVSGYEIAIKCMQGKMDFAILETLAVALREARFDDLPVTMTHAIAAGELAGPHRDPWDRLLMAQARIESLTIVTTDAEFASYGVKTLW
jgi:PIN domain nuclease of toxin-antitoxin system